MASSLSCTAQQSLSTESICVEEVQHLVAPDDTGYTNMDSMWDKLLCYGLHMQKLKPPSSFESAKVQKHVLCFQPARRARRLYHCFSSLIGRLQAEDFEAL
ncbi:hypothetical protein LSAT2_027110 [Lamellibrachia satsuma]|nr:hypothetical protein LSAT2_027110 [Lamellibrachia satsuma]